MKKWKINYLGFLSLLSLLAILGWTTGDSYLYAYLAFLVFIRYFWVVPDEMFMLNAHKAAFLALMIQFISLVPSMFLFSFFLGARVDTPMAFCLSVGIAIFVFCGYLAFLEWREEREMGND
ncbi:MAG: DUF3796 domain-containing protein [Bacillota bacterium]|nr:DUF3796 domain-containing protein [Bacillota bacterium]